MSPKQLTALEGKKYLVGEVGDKASSTWNMRAAQPVLAGLGVNGLKYK